MRSLFAKIFVAFFLTVIVLGLLLELTAMRTEMRRIDTVFRPLAEQAAASLAATYEQGGAGALPAATSRLPLPAVLLDDRGQPIGAVPPELESSVAAARQLIAESSEPLASFIAWRNFALQPTQTASGRRFVLVTALPHERWIAILNTLDQHPAWRLSIVGLVAGLICLVLARHITRPLVRLRATAERMAGGHLDARAGPALAKRHDEIGALGRDFDVMADRLSALVSTQRQLLADVSHELRSPLARLRVALGLARRHAHDPAAPDMRTQLDADLARIDLEASRLDQMIGQALAIARIDSGVESGPRERFELTTIVHEIAADGDYEAHASGRRVTIVGADACTMTGDVELVRSAIENVVRNAVRHTAPGTTVDIELRQTARDTGAPAARLRVRDRGPGVPDAQLADIFRPFTKAASSSDDHTEGAGLGLAIAERVVRRHGGQIRAANAADGGLEVEITLPLDGESFPLPSSDGSRDSGAETVTRRAN